MSQRCEYLLHECRKCKHLFRRDERYENCPFCGEPRQCENYASADGGKFCKQHHGASLKYKYGGRHKGRALVTGSQSKSLIPRLASKYLEQRNDGMYVLNKRSIYLVDDRIVDLLDRVDAESSADRMNSIINAWNNFKAAFPGLRSYVRSDQKAINALDTLEAEMEAAYHDYQAWRQIFEALELRRKLSESEMKILKDMQALMTAEDGMELAAQLFAAIMDVLRDVPHGQDYIHLIRIKFEKITGANDLGETEEGRGTIIDIEPR